MSDLEQNLLVLTGHIRALEGRQRDLGSTFHIASQADAELGAKVWDTHGLASALMNSAVSTAVATRAAGLKNMSKISYQLAERLDEAAANYDNVDWREGRNIGACSV